MGKNRKWQLICIIAVTLLTVYNILPTLFYYLQPLQEPIGKKTGETIALDIQKRIGSLEEQSVEWIASFCDLIHVHPKKVSIDPNRPDAILVSFVKAEEANRFRSHLPRSGSLIPFAPARLQLSLQDEDPKSVTVLRQIPIHIEKDAGLISWVSKEDPEYRKIILDRGSKIVQSLTNNKEKNLIQALLKQDGHYSFGNQNPVFSDLLLDFSKGTFTLKLHAKAENKNELLVKEVSKITRFCNEKVIQTETGFEIAFHSIPNASGSLVLHLEKIGRLEIQNLISTLKTIWNPKHPDLQNMAITDANGYETLSFGEKSNCLVLFSPFLSESLSSFENDSIYIVAKGFERIAKNYENFPDSPLAHTFHADVQALRTILYQNGFEKSLNSKDLATIPWGGDFIAEKPHFAYPIIQASREEFQVTGSKKYAHLDLSNLEHRILTENKIDTSLHQELIKWRDDYLSAQVSLNPQTRFDTPKPVRSVFWNNLKLSLCKMVRGDEKKIIRWGLDLSGGKSVEIELRDGNNQLVESDFDLKQGMSELYSRVGKMGLSEVVIRQVGKHIVLDFPGSQSLSASELIKASTMFFHVVNEKFSPMNQLLGDATNRFLQSVWDEAVFVGNTSSQSINEIAKKNLYGETLSEDAKLLKTNGLKLSKDSASQGSVDQPASKIVIQRGSSPLEWHGMPHPLMIVFQDHALEGSHLENIHASYDPSRGNFLSFSIASSFQNREGVRVNPQNTLHAWTSQYSKENVLGTSNETYSHGRGWRMAVVLNDTVISSPTLDSALKESAQISGSFSQTEVQHLCNDLKAGSLTFTPHILSEKNVSPELGQTDRTKGIVATVVALALVIGCMIAYYRFAGLVASVAVIFNILILWGVLQNLGASLTLAGIAGIILTVGMSIDANVLVFERIKEEFAITGRIQSAIQAGYNKAFSAIVDSNITTIIAALILLNFDAGPIKSFAMNLIIGIVSSMFTALFMTRFYFTGWAQNPKNKMLKMANWVRTTRFDFLKQTKVAFTTVSLIIIAGSCFLFAKSSSILGLDFTGGYSLYLKVEKQENLDYAKSVQTAFVQAGANPQDFLIQEMNPASELRILFGEGLEQNGKPFSNLPLEVEAKGAKYLYEKNPRISWVVNALKANDITLSEKTKASLHSDWTAVSGQMSDTMRNNAIFGFLLSFVGIFIYLAFRFEYKFAAAAIACLIHDVLITLAIMGLLHALHVPIQLDLITIAALMTAVGYSLNDTIIIFDRIREEMSLHTRRNLKDTINHALNFTLSRTMITSGTTLLVLIALLVLGGASIFGFALVMTIGVIFGTLSSWFIAAPIMLFFHNTEEKKHIVIDNS